jgi:hypothetical protein
VVEIIVEHDSLFKHALSRGPECPPFEQLVEGIHAKDEAALRHMAACPHCSSEFKQYWAFMEGTVLPEEKRSVRWVAKHLQDPSRPSRSTGAWWNVRHLIPAALAVAAAAMFVTIGMNSYQNGPRSDGGSAIERSQTVELLAPKGDLDAPFPAFRWNAVPMAVHYRVRLMEVDKTILWDSVVSSASVPLPQSMERLVLPGKRLLWAVDAVDAGGRVIATGTQDFRRQIRKAR